MFYRENGQFKTSYAADQQIFTIAQDRYAILGLLAIAFLVIPLVASDYTFQAILIPFVIMSLGALGLNILVGYCGQISLGTAAFMAVGAYAAFNFQARFENMPLLIALIGGGLCAMVVGVVFGLPSLRIRGLYLAVATLAAQFFSDWMFLRVLVDQQLPLGSVSVPKRWKSWAGQSTRPWPSTCSAWPSWCVMALAGQKPGAQCHRPRVDGHPRHGRGRQRDRHPPDVRQALGLCRELASSSAWPVRCGALCTWVRGKPATFGLNQSLQLLFMIIIGGLGSIVGSIFGAAFFVLLPLFLNQVPHWMGLPISTATATYLEHMIFGALIVFFLIVEPHGLAKLWATARQKLRVWPFPH